MSTTTAVSFDDTLADAHGYLAMVRLEHDWNWAEAEREFKRALELNPNNANNRHNYAHFLLHMGRVEESRAESERAVQINPFDTMLRACLGWHCLYTHQLEEAIEHCRVGISIWRWASTNDGEDPEILLACCGDNLTLEVMAAAALVAQGLDPTTLLKPPADTWLTYHGDYSGQRHSKLTQITPQNVHQLTLAWAFQTNQSDQIKASPILHNGVMYITTPDNLWAIDARAGRQIWRYTYPPNQEISTTSRRPDRKVH